MELVEARAVVTGSRADAAKCLAVFARLYAASWMSLTRRPLAALALPLGVRDGAGGVLEAYAGEPFSLQVVGEHLTILDRIRIVDAGGPRCGWHAVPSLQPMGAPRG